MHVSRYKHTYLHGNMHAYTSACLATHIHTIYIFIDACLHIYVTGQMV